MPSKSASKKRSSSKNRSSSAKKRRTHRQLTPPSPKNLNMRPNAPAAAPVPVPNAPANAVKSHSKKTWRNLLRGPSEGNLMKKRMEKMERRYDHYLRTGQVRPLSP